MFGLKKLNRCDVYLALNLLYSMQGLLYPSGAFNQMLQLIIIIWGLVVFMRYIAVPARQTKFLKATSVLVFMYCLYGGILIILETHYLSIFPIYQQSIYIFNLHYAPCYEYMCFPICKRRVYNSKSNSCVCNGLIVVPNPSVLLPTRPNYVGF